MDECEEESDEDFDAISSASETDNGISSSDEKSSGGSSDEFDPEQTILGGDNCQFLTYNVKIS